MDATPYNPLDQQNLASSVVEALLRRDPYPMADVPNFPGSGIYAIYYTGDHSLYSDIGARNRAAYDQPIYVGKADTCGRRKGSTIIDPLAGNSLSRRLREHQHSIHAARDLDVNDFCFRTLVVEDIWIASAESLVINMFSPAWNCLVEGFGNHDPGSGRYKGKRPLWDVLHPGRAWAERCAQRDETADEITASMSRYLLPRVLELSIAKVSV